MSKSVSCLVKNRSAGMVVYRIPEDGIRREFQPGEVKKINYLELEKLTYQPGGRALIANFLQVTDEKVTEELNIHTENEYYMSEEDVKNLILNGSLDAFLDALDYAPLGVMDLIKKYAISLPMNDIEKREALKKTTGFDVTVALENLRQEKMVDEKTEASAAATTTTTSRRRTNTNYKVVEPKEKTENKEEKSE